MEMFKRIILLLAILGFTATTLCLPAEPQPLPTLSSPTSTVPSSDHASSAPTAAHPEQVVEALEERQNTFNEDNPPPYVPIVTAAPTQDEALASLGWKQTTYYECRTRDGAEHCGWHIPVYKAGAEGRERGVKGWRVVVGVVLVGLVL
ncbi:hypothetical protein ACJ41O_006856 [Fusarium nematophilum]